MSWRKGRREENSETESESEGESARRNPRGGKITRKTDANYRGKKITVFVNGNDIIPGKKFAVTESRYPTWDSLLDDLASQLDLRWTINRLYTIRGKEVHSFSQLKDGDNYVAAGAKFVKGSYGTKQTATWNSTNRVLQWPGSAPSKSSATGSRDDGYESDPPHTSKPKKEKKTTISDKNRSPKRRAKSYEDPRRRRGKAVESDSEEEQERRKKRNPHRKKRAPTPPRRTNKSNFW